MIKTNNLIKSYKQGSNAVFALNDVSIAIDDGEFLSIIGKSGSGKSTLLHLLGGLDNPSSGTVSYDSTLITSLSEDELTRFRRKNIGFVFQSYQLIPELSVYENIIYPALFSKADLDMAYIEEIIEVLELTDRVSHLPSELSGGQMQRTAIARALANKPKVLLCDEPTGNLDSESSDNVIEAILKTKNKFNKTIVIVTHDRDLAGKADTILMLKDGKVQNDC